MFGPDDPACHSASGPHSDLFPDLAQRTRQGRQARESGYWGAAVALARWRFLTQLGHRRVSVAVIQPSVDGVTKSQIARGTLDP